MQLDVGVDREILSRFAVGAARALEVSKLLGPEERLASRLTILHRISDYIQGVHDLDKLLSVVLTGVTAGYGLGFNRAALFICVQTPSGGPSGGEFTGKDGIGFLEEPAARADWEKHHDQGLEDFARYLDALERDACPRTPVGEAVRELHIPWPAAGLFRECIDRGQPIFLDDDSVGALPESFREAFRPAGPLVVVPLKAGGRGLGVIVVDNKFTRSEITSHDAEALVTFANTAAIALHTVALLEEKDRAAQLLRNVESAASLAAKVTVLGDRQESLDAIVQGTLTAMHCDAVVLYTYDASRKELEYPPTLYGVEFPTRVTRAGRVPLDSVVYEILTKDGPYIADDVPHDGLFGGRRFAREERIKACIALPLRVGNDDAGVMFVNYRREIDFNGEEVARAGLFANYAAIAIRNSQLYEKTRRDARHLTALYSGAKAMVASLAGSAEAVLKEIVEQAVRSVVQNEPDRKAFGTLQLVSAGGDLLRFVSAFPSSRYDELRRDFGETMQIQLGITGRTARLGTPQRVDDVAVDPEYVSSDQAVKSELAVPLRDGADIVGVLNVESRESEAFDVEDERTLVALAELAVVAIRISGVVEGRIERASTA